MPEGSTANVKFAALSIVFEVALIVLFGIGATYAPDAQAVNDLNPTDYPGMQFRYPFYQDVHVMIFVGFGFLMTFLYRHGFSAVGYNFMIAAFSVQWAMLCRGFFYNASTGIWDRIPLDLTSLINADFCAASVLITMGALLGKVNALQLLVVAAIEVAFYALNEYILIYKLVVTDIGGSMVIHAFGAYFGLACAWVLGPRSSSVDRSDNASNAASDTFSMIGTLFLWLFWPSFNAATADSSRQQRAVINTLLSVCTSSFVGFLASVRFRGHRKFTMVDIQNATLAGGVAIGSSADLMLEPYGCIMVGAFAGYLSVWGFVEAMPFLEERISLYDTCGVHNLHGMPGVLAGIVAAIAAATTGTHAYDGNESIEWPDLYERGGRVQAGYQLLGLSNSVGFGLIAGSLTGLLIRRPWFEGPTKLYNDVEFWFTEDDEGGDVLSEDQTMMDPQSSNLNQASLL